MAPGADPQPGLQSQPPTRLVAPPLPAAPVHFLVHKNQFLCRFCRVHKRLWHQLAFVLSLPLLIFFLVFSGNLFVGKISYFSNLHYPHTQL